MINKSVIIISLILLIMSSLGCIENKQIEETGEEKTIIVETPVIVEKENGQLPANMIFRSDNIYDFYNMDIVIMTVQNIGETTANNIYVGIMKIDFSPSYNNGLRWNYNISEHEKNDLLNNMFDKTYIIDTGFNNAKIEEGMRSSTEKKELERETLKLHPTLLTVFIGDIEPGEIVDVDLPITNIGFNDNNFIFVIYDDAGKVF